MDHDIRDRCVFGASTQFKEAKFATLGRGEAVFKALQVAAARPASVRGPVLRSSVAPIGFDLNKAGYF